MSTNLFVSRLAFGLAAAWGGLAAAWSGFAAACGRLAEVGKGAWYVMSVCLLYLYTWVLPPWIWKSAVIGEFMTKRMAKNEKVKLIGCVYVNLKSFFTEKFEFSIKFKFSRKNVLYFFGKKLFT